MLSNVKNYKFIFRKKFKKYVTVVPYNTEVNKTCGVCDFL